MLAADWNFSSHSKPIAYLVFSFLFGYEVKSTTKTQDWETSVVFFYKRQHTTKAGDPTRAGDPDTGHTSKRPFLGCLPAVASDIETQAQASVGYIHGRRLSMAELEG